MRIAHGKPSTEAKRTWEALRHAVADKLDEKRRLGHYYVIWKDGRPVFIGEDAPSDDSGPTARQRNLP
jgi:hypothetical protein